MDDSYLGDGDIGDGMRRTGSAVSSEGAGGDGRTLLLDGDMNIPAEYDEAKAPAHWYSHLSLLLWKNSTLQARRPVRPAARRPHRAPCAAPALACPPAHLPTKLRVSGRLAEGGARPPGKVPRPRPARVCVDTLAGMLSRTPPGCRRAALHGGSGPGGAGAGVPLSGWR